MRSYKTRQRAQARLWVLQVKNHDGPGTRFLLQAKRPFTACLIYELHTDLRRT